MEPNQMQGNMPHPMMMNQQAQPSQPQQAEGGAELAQVVAQVRDILLAMKEKYPQMASSIDKAIQSLIDGMTEQVGQQSSQGEEVAYA